MNEIPEKRHIALEVIYILLIALAAMGDYPMLGLSTDMTRAIKAVTLLIAAVGLGVMFVSGNMRRIKTSASFVGVYGFVLLGIIVWSIFLWILNLETIDFILRGTLKFVFQCIVLLIIFAAAYMFGERSIYATFYGLALANGVMILISLGIYGPTDSLNSIITMLSGGGSQEGFTRAMEIHDITFTYGFFIIYFLFFAQHTRERAISIIIAAVFFILGWKRIALFSIIVVMFLAIAMGRMRSRYRIGLMKFIAWTVVFASFAYILIVRYHIFETILAYFNLDSMGRNEVYDYISDYYTVSVGFMGYGFEYTTVILQSIMENHPEAHIGVVALHNNILTEYIELGFVGFWAWLLYTWIFQLNWMLNHWGEKVAMLFFFCELYIFITYATDNTLYYFFSSLVLRLMPLAYSFHQRTEQDVRLWPWVRVQKKL